MYLTYWGDKPAVLVLVVAYGLVVAVPELIYGFGLRFAVVTVGETVGAP